MDEASPFPPNRDITGRYPPTNPVDAKLNTVRVVNDLSKRTMQAYVTINAVDFNPERDVLYVEPNRAA